MGCVPTGRRINSRQGMTSNSAKENTARITPTFPQGNQIVTQQTTAQVVTVTSPPQNHPPLQNHPPPQTFTPASFKAQGPPNQYKVSTVVGGPPPPGTFVSQLPPMQPLTPHSQTRVNTGAPSSNFHQQQQQQMPAPQRMTSPSAVHMNQQPQRPNTPPPPQYQGNQQTHHPQGPPPPNMNGQSQYRLIQQTPQQLPSQQYPQQPYKQPLQPPQPPQSPQPPASSAIHPQVAAQYMTSISRVNMSGHSQTALINQSVTPAVNQSNMPDSTGQKQSVETSAYRSAVFGSSNNNAPNQSMIRELNRESADVNDEKFSEIRVEKMDFGTKGGTKAY